MVEEYFFTRMKKLEQEIPELEKIVEKSPKGTLVACKIKGKNRWYLQQRQKDGSYSRSYIGLKDVELAKQLARKAYFKALLKDEQNELSCIKRYIKSRKTTKHGELISLNSPYRELLGLRKWDIEDYERSSSHPENLIVKAPKGERVRSKSEALIANALFGSGIKYRYECRLELGDITFFPDFTIMSERTQKLVIWEHFGIIDDPAYFDNMMKKIGLYISNGYLPGQNLIMTFESRTNPLTIDVVQEIITKHLV